MSLAAIFHRTAVKESLDSGQVRHMAIFEASHCDTAVITEWVEVEKFGGPQAYFAPPTGTWRSLKLCLGECKKVPLEVEPVNHLQWVVNEVK